MPVTHLLSGFVELANQTMNKPTNLQRILIVGGGTAGWMSAAYLGRLLGKTPCQITVVESPKIRTIGVGEATIPSFVELMRRLKIDEFEMMRRCNATYKLGVKFIDWVNSGHSYWHPFGVCGGFINELDLFHYWLRSQREGRHEGPYSSYSLQRLLGETATAPRPIEGSSRLIDLGAYAYHLDAAALAAFLKEVALKDGVVHVAEEVCRVDLDQRGYIENVHLESGRNLSADLYIDCTGFRSVLIGEALDNRYLDWSDQLLCDRAVVTALPADRVSAPYTQSKALNAGWVWQIPLNHRVGCGYVFSSAHLSDEAAAKELLAYTGQAVEAHPNLRFIDLQVGRRESFWVHNCVSVGLSSGFVEPLESTGLHLMQKSLDLLWEYFPERGISNVLVKRYNERMSRAYAEIRDFVILHYHLNKRDQYPFWLDSGNVKLPSSLQNRLDLYDEVGIIEHERDSPFPPTSFYHILSSSGRLPRRVLPQAFTAEANEIWEILDGIKERNMISAAEFPTNEKWMRWLHAVESP
jgi:tryptophan halogenase